MFLSSDVPETFVEWIRTAELASVFSDFAAGFKNTGLYGLLGTLLFVISWLLFPVGALVRRSGILGVALFLAVLACGVGWFGSYNGYRKAMNVIESSTTSPRREDIQKSASEMIFTGVWGTVGLAGTVLVALPIAALLSRRRRRANDA